MDHFDLLAPVYDRFLPPSTPERLIALADLSEGRRLLDVGGGTGRISSMLLGMASQIVVADLSQGMLRRAAARPGLGPVRSASEALPFYSQSFDRVIMVDALHHVYSQSDTAREMWRVLRPGGRIVIEEPDIRSGVVKVIALIERLVFMRSHFLSPPQIAALFPQTQARVSLEGESHTAWVIVERGA